jgi:hypothetical protein
MLFRQGPILGIDSPAADGVPSAAWPDGGRRRVSERGGRLVVYLEAQHQKNQQDFTLVMDVVFAIGDRQVAAAFLIDLFKQTIFLTFEREQRMLIEEEEGEFLNERAVRARGTSR